LAAWKAIEDSANGDIHLVDSPMNETPLNNADDPRPYIPRGSLYVATGSVQNGLVEKIREDLRQAFPGNQAPTFPGVSEDSFVAYSYMEANLKFSLPYFQSATPLEFLNPDGHKTGVASFGIRTEDAYACRRLRGQPRVLFRTLDVLEKEFEFALDLDARSSPSQIVVARFRREPTLAAALLHVERAQADFNRAKGGDPKYAKYLEEMGPNDVLLVPNMFWRMSHHFSEIEGKAFKNPSLDGKRLDVAQQDISFRLDRGGAELRSEAKLYSRPIPRHFVLDRPFLIYMKQRGATVPYFVMWVENAELLTHW
jgi:hypothetical protein